MVGRKVHCPKCGTQNLVGGEESRSTTQPAQQPSASVIRVEINHNSQSVSGSNESENKPSQLALKTILAVSGTLITTIVLAWFGFSDPKKLKPESPSEIAAKDKMPVKQNPGNTKRPESPKKEVKGKPYIPAGIISRWTFETDASDCVGTLHGTLSGGATVHSGRLKCDGKTAYLETKSIPTDLLEMTLEVWLAVSDLGQTTTVPFYISDDQEEDGFLYGGQRPKIWSNFSPNYARSSDTAVPLENAPSNKLIHLVMTFDSQGAITIYREGRVYHVAYTKGKLATYRKDISRLFMGGVASYRLPARGFFNGEIEEARLYNKSLTSEEVFRSFTTANFE